MARTTSSPGLELTPLAGRRALLRAAGVGALGLAAAAALPLVLAPSWDDDPAAPPPPGTPLHADLRAGELALLLTLHGDGPAPTTVLVNDLLAGDPARALALEPGRPRTLVLPRAPRQGYAVRVAGPDGFLREWHGRGLPAEAAVIAGYERHDGYLVLRLDNPGPTPRELWIESGGRAERLSLSPGASRERTWRLADRRYAVAVSDPADPAYRRVFAGRLPAPPA